MTLREKQKYGDNKKMHDCQGLEGETNEEGSTGDSEDPKTIL